ncbi:hypothetical protein AB0M31_06120 [Streptomyces sp. NPDC051773]|uniref:hypothetical protein n=1 Tax=Streptomyces sp. NPDC051773 TaxID=3156682 RepID=UPI00342F2E55
MSLRLALALLLAGLFVLFGAVVALAAYANAMASGATSSRALGKAVKAGCTVLGVTVAVLGFLAKLAGLV